MGIFDRFNKKTPLHPPSNPPEKEESMILVGAKATLRPHGPDLVYVREDYADEKGQAYLREVLKQRLEQNPALKGLKLLQGRGETNPPEKERLIYDLHICDVPTDKQLEVKNTVKQEIETLNGEIPDKSTLQELVSLSERSQTRRESWQREERRSEIVKPIVDMVIDFAKRRGMDLEPYDYELIEDIKLAYDQAREVENKLGERRWQS